MKIILKINHRTHKGIKLAFYGILIMVFTCTTLINVVGQVSEVELDRSRFLLLDSRIVEKTENAKLETGTVEKHPANPLFSEDKPWEKRFDNLYGNVIFDEEENIYKCWYSPFTIDHSSQGMTPEQRDKKYKPPRGREMSICYATSKDGIHWDKPALGLVEYEGRKQNNIIWRDPHGAGVFKDLHEKDPAKRYKTIFKGLSVSFSTDGIHWGDKTKVNGVSVAGDTHNNAFWAPTLNRFVGITRTWGKEFGREVARIESDDFINWTKEEVVLHGREYDLQTYAMPTFYYGGVYLGLLAIHEQSTDRVWTELSWSPDTKNWYRISPGSPLIPCSEKELDYDYGCVYACANPIFTKNEIRLYYGGSDWLHTSWRNGSLCLATLRPDGFAGYVQESKNKPAVLITTPVAYEGQSIRITADVAKGGLVRVSAVDINGKPIAKARTVSKTATDKKLKFNKKIKADMIKFKLEFVGAKIYSFSFSG